MSEKELRFLSMHTLLMGCLVWYMTGILDWVVLACLGASAVFRIWAAFREHRVAGKDSLSAPDGVHIIGQ